MIHYSLRCDAGHGFESWFPGSEAFDRQVAAGMVECPVCASPKVERALMTPAVAKAPGVKGRPAPVSEVVPANVGPAKMASGPMPAQVVALLQRMRAEVEKNCDYVGGDFAEEARRIHNGEVEARGIYGEASADEAEALRDDGIEVGQLPWLPRADG